MRTIEAVVLGAALVFALWIIIRSFRKGTTCSGCCAGCTANCSKRKP